MDIISVHFVLSCMSSEVPKCMFLDVLAINGILFIAMMSISSVTSPYLFNISSGTCIHVMLTCFTGRLVILPFTNPRFGPKCLLPLVCLSLNIAVRNHIAFDVFNEILRTWSSYYILKSICFFNIRILSNRIFRFIAIYCMDQYGPNIMCHI